jgi:hypothetical protein
MKPLSALVVLALLASLAKPQDLVVHTGETVTISEPLAVPAPWLFLTLHYDTIIVETGGTLRFEPMVYGAKLIVHRGILVEGLIDFSGQDGPIPRKISSPLLQNIGGAGGPGGSRGGIGNPNPGQSNPKGGDALDAYDTQVSAAGGVGGETAYGSFSPWPAAGGGGGRLAADQPVTTPPLSPANLGLVATAGMDGFPTAHGAIGGQIPPAGGVAGPSAFIDANPANDFWGRRFVPSSGAIVIGELASPIGGRGGGAGGNVVLSTTYPTVPWTHFNNIPGRGAGGGGGLAVIVTPRMNIVGEGRIRANGGNGPAIPWPGSTNETGGGGGGGSGGMIVLQITTLDLRAANLRCITALGGRGGTGFTSHHDEIGAGGNGGPGILQLHMVNGPTGILLPPNKALADMTAPTALVLLPEPSL